MHLICLLVCLFTIYLNIVTTWPHHLHIQLKKMCFLSCSFFLFVVIKEYTLSEYLRMSGIYWGLTVMDLMGQLPRMNQQEIIDFITACQHECGGISASIGHDPHLLYTLSAIQVITVDIKCVFSFISALQCIGCDGIYKFSWEVSVVPDICLDRN